MRHQSTDSEEAEAMEEMFNLDGNEKPMTLRVGLIFICLVAAGVTACYFGGLFE